MSTIPLANGQLSSPSLGLKGKVAFVTGGGRGMGLCSARALAAAGATVIITYNSKDPSEIAKDITAQTGSAVHVYRCAAENSDEVNEIVERASQEVGEVDIIVANAGVALWRDTIDMTDEELQWMMGINLFAPIYLVRAFVRHWLGLPAAVSGERGARPGPRNLNKKIVFMSSISAIVNMTPQTQVAYNASKAGLTMACKTLAGEWAQYGITLNCVSPGYVDTDMIRHPPEGFGEAWIADWRKRTPVDRFADPQELGNMVLLLCSDLASSFLTGHDVVMDGGYTTY